MIVTTKAIVFSAIKYAEADLIVTCFTEKSGIKSYLLRRILKSKTGKLKTSQFQLLTQLELVAYHKNKGSLESIREAKVIFPYKTLHTNVIKTGMIMFLAEMLKNCIKEEEPNEGLFEYLENVLFWLDCHEEIANFHILFLLKLSSHLGFHPDDSGIDNQYFNLLDGRFQEYESGIYCEKGQVVADFKRFFGINFDAVSVIKINKKSSIRRSKFVVELLSITFAGL